MIRKGLFLIFFVGLGFFFYRKEPLKIPPKTSHYSQIKKSYFLPLPVDFDVEFNLAYVPIQIGELHCRALIDSGSDNYLSLSRDFLGKIPNKKELGVRKTFGLRGTEFCSNQYQVDSIQIGSLVFETPIEEYTKGFAQESRISCDERPLNKGKIGWKLFQMSNLLLDFPQKKAAFADSFETVQQNGYQNRVFLSAPLLLDRNLVEFEATFDEKKVRCTLDTGCSCDIWVIPPSKESLEELLKKPSIQGRFQIKGEDFGLLSLKPLPIQIPLPLEVFLGAEFCQKHVLFLDFQKQRIYVECLSKE